METPPRAWGRLGNRKHHTEARQKHPHERGEDAKKLGLEEVPVKHPHERGEDCNRRNAGRGQIETPPRAWGRLVLVSSAVEADRNTPTSVGKTC